MISSITGRLLRLNEDTAILEVGPFQYEVLVPEIVRRQLQGSLGRSVTLTTLHYIEGAPGQGRLSPRLVGFLSPSQKEFFELFCSVDGLGVRKALRALCWPVPDLASAIYHRDTARLSTLPGIGSSTAEKIVAKLRKHVEPFLVLVKDEPILPDVAPPDAVEDAYRVLIQSGYAESEARLRLDRVLRSGKRFENVQQLLQELFRLEP
jgi:Holliday junction DNA helicase RuvA